MPSLQRRIARVLALGWADAGAPAPELEPGDRREIARRARRSAHDALGRDATGPGELARALGIRLHCLPISGCGGEVASADRVIFRWSPDRSVRHHRVAHGIAHALLLREKWTHSESDALLLTPKLL